jgi:hypothetical protein
MKKIFFGLAAAVFGLIFGLIILVPPPVFGGQLRVSQLGQPWLVPDDYMDTVVNPARINFIGKSIFVGGLDNFIYKQNLSVPNDDTSWDFTPRAAYMGINGDIGEGLIYRLPYALSIIKTGEYARTLDNDITLIFGSKLGDKLSTGISLNVLSHDDGFASPELTGSFKVNLGADYKLDQMDLGAVLTAGNSFTGLSNADLGLGILGEINTGAGELVRFFNQLDYNGTKAAELLYDGVHDPFGGRAFGSYKVINETAGSYISAYNTIKYFISLNNIWTVVQFANSATADAFSSRMDESTQRSDNLYLQAGFETKLFVDWFTVRASYVPVGYQFTTRHNLTQYGNVTTRNSEDDSTITLLDQSVSVGFGVDLGKDSVLDIGVNSPGVISYLNQKNTSTGNADSWVETGFSILVVEYTMRF